MASEIRVDKINSLSGVGTVTLSPTGVDIAGITTVATFKVGTGVTVSSDGDVFTTGVTTATTFVGALTGNVTGNVTGNISGGTVAGSTGTFTGDVDIADKIVHTGDTNTAIRFPDADTITAETGGSERVRIDSSGNLSLGTSTSIQKFTIDNGGISLDNGWNTQWGVNASRSYIQGEDGNGNDRLILGTNNTERLRIQSNGDVYLNATQGSTAVSSGAIRRFNAGLDYWSGTAGSANAIKYAAHGAGDDNMYGIGISNSLLEMQSQVDIGFFCGSAGSGTGRRVERFRMKSTGDLQVLDGNLVIGTSGHGIDFSATSDASGSSNELLDDYEEGTWTPSVTGGTISNSGSYYTKIGRVVHWYCYGYVSNTANDGNQFRIYGLPYTVGSNAQGLNNYYGNAATFSYTASANQSGLGVLTPLAHGGSTYIYFHFIGIGDPNPPVNSYWHSHMLNQSFIIAGSYFV